KEGKRDLSRPSWNPFATAKEGDWCSLLVKMKQGDYTVSNVYAYRVEKVAADLVTVAKEARNTQATLKGETLVFSRTRAPSAVEFFPKRIFTEAKAEGEKRTIAGKVFACEKISLS